MLYPLTLSTSINGWRLFHLRSQDQKFKPIADKIQQKAKGQCAFCGFCSACHMSVVNIDTNYHNNAMSNLALACPFCLQCQFIESIGVSGFGGGVLIHLPEMQQHELNLLSHTLFAQMIQGGVYADQAIAHYRDLKLRSKIVDTELGAGMSKPSRLGRLLLDSESNSENSLNMKDCLQQLRLLPLYPKFLQQLLNWSLEALSVGPSQQALIQQLTATGAVPEII